MRVRKELTREWTQAFYGPRFLSATDLAWDTRTEQELVRHKGHRHGSAFLDCSKCCERVPHKLAQASAVSPGCPRAISNLVFSLYGGDYARGNLQRCGGNTGIVAGCGFAVHILRSFLHPPDLKYGTNVRIYVDDIALAACAKTPWGVVRAIGFALPSL